MDLTTLALFFTAVPIGVFAVVFGGTMFLSVPVFLLLFPQLTLGALIGNIKIGSVFRNIVALIPLYKIIRYKNVSALLLPLGVGSAVGAYGITEMSQYYVLPILVVSFAVCEYASILGKYISLHLKIVLTFLIGIYGGIFGAGISLLLVALLRTQHTADTEIYVLRAEALFLEAVLVIISVFVFAHSGLLQMSIWLPWTLGAMIGGYLGGMILKYMGKVSPFTQKLILRIAFAIAIAIAIYTLI